MLRFLMIFAFLAGSFNCNLLADSPYTLEAETVLRVMNPEKTVYAFNLKAKGFPKSTPVDITIEMMNGKKQFHEDYYVGDDGIVMDGQTEKPGLMILGLAMQGEPFLVSIRGASPNEKAATLVIPYPYEATDNKGHKLTLIRTTTDSKGYYWIAEGFKPKEKLVFTSKSATESGSHPVIANDKGKVEGALMSGVVGLASASASIQLVGKDSNLLINYVWGKDGMTNYGAYFAQKELDAKLEELRLEGKY